MDEYGNYHLVLEDNVTGDRKYMDFQGKQCFMPKEYTMRSNVPLAAIDELTCHFVNEDHMRLAITKEDDMGEHHNNMYITYKQQGEKRLHCIYNDDKLAHIASKTVGAKKGLLNLNDQVTNDTLYAMFREIIRFGSSFSSEALSGNSFTYAVNDHNAKIIRELHRNPPKKESEAFRLFRSRFTKDDAFGNYKEFRALYLTYKGYMEKRRRINEQLLKGVIPTKEDTQITSNNDNYSSPIEEEKQQEIGKDGVQLSMFEMFKR